MMTQITLLRGINVGGRNPLPMADLRAALESDGYANVRTYIQSGNVLVDSPSDDCDATAARVQALIGSRFGLDVPVIVLDVAALADVVASVPYADEADPRRVHAIFLGAEPDAAALTRVREVQDSAAAKGSRDRATSLGRTIYLHTPDGFGTSTLAKALTSRTSPVTGTARNWATVTTLLAMCRSAPDA